MYALRYKNTRWRNMAAVVYVVLFSYLFEGELSIYYVVLLCSYKISIDLHKSMGKNRDKTCFIPGCKTG